MIRTLLTCLMILSAHAESKILDSQVIFTAIGNPTFIKVRGEGKIKQATLNQSNGIFLVDLNTLSTGIELRDTHMKEKYLNVKKFPHAKLVFDNVNIAMNDDERTVPCTFSLNGKSKKINVMAKVKKKDKKIQVDATFEIMLTDYQIEIPSYKGITIANKVLVSSQLSLESQK